MDVTKEVIVYSAGIIGAILSSIHILWQTMQMQPLETAYKESWRLRSYKNLFGTTFVIIFLIFVILYLVNFGSSLTNSFVLLGSILLIAVLTLPLLLWGLVTSTKFIQIKNPIAIWFWADTRQQIGPLSLSLMALLIALSTNIGVSGMVGSFRITFLGWLDQRLMSELYLKTPDKKTAKEITSFLEGKVDAILPIIKTPIRIMNRPVDVFGFLPHSSYVRNWPLINHKKDPWKYIERGNGKNYYLV